MKTINFTLLVAIGVALFFTTIIFASCSKNKESELCESVICLNSGVCIDGKCSCPNGFEGENCGITWSQKYFGERMVSETCVAPSLDTYYNAYRLGIGPNQDSTSLMLHNFWGLPECSIPGFIPTSQSTFKFTEGASYLYQETYVYKVVSGEGRFDVLTSKITGIYLLEVDDIKGLNYHRKYTVYFEME